MKLPQRLPVTHRNQRDPLVLHVLVQVALHVNAHRRGALVQYRIYRPVVNQPSHRHALLLTARKHVIPLVLRVPATLTLHQVFKLDLSENFLEFLLVDTLAFHVLNCVRVYNLIAQCSLGQVWALGDVEDLIDGWLVDYATEDWPKLPEDTEQRRFTATVGSCDEEVHPRLDLKVHGSDQDIPVW